MLRICSLFVLGSVLIVAGCDQQPATPVVAPPPSENTPAATGASTTAPVVAQRDVLNEPRSRISLGVIPFSVEVPASWQVQSGTGSFIFLHAVLPSGEVDILLSTQPFMKADDTNPYLRELEKPTNDPLVKNSVADRGGIKVVQQIAPMGAGGDPNTALISWTTKFMIPDRGLDYSVYEMNILGITRTMYEQDHAFIQSILDTVRYDSAATQPATLP